jgi:hypothetical protein
MVTLPKCVWVSARARLCSVDARPWHPHPQAEQAASGATRRRTWRRTPIISGTSSQVEICPVARAACRWARPWRAATGQRSSLPVAGAAAWFAFAKQARRPGRCAAASLVPPKKLQWERLEHCASGCLKPTGPFMTPSQRQCEPTSGCEDADGSDSERA